MKRKFILGAIPVLLLVAAGIYFYGGGRVPDGQPPLQSLTRANITTIRNAFNAAKDDTRVLLLLSPT
ncbi:MAG TPA: hypothetical protein VG168_06545 [Bryobacteraceae bacterium]|nr:hypothetical protein [Bryobacteraceae bacterium]